MWRTLRRLLPKTRTGELVGRAVRPDESSRARDHVDPGVEDRQAAVHRADVDEDALRAAGRGESEQRAPGWTPLEGRPEWEPW